MKTKYLEYFSENICGFSSISYWQYIKLKGPRNYVSLYTIKAEKVNKYS